MSGHFDMIVVGSGPAGVSAAFPLVEAGAKVLMVDGGREPEISPPQVPFMTARYNDESQWRWIVGENYHALQASDDVSPKLRAPTLGYVFDRFREANKVSCQDFVAVGSLAAGGMSNAWGCGVARLSEKELSAFPFGQDDIALSYRSVSRRIGISGRAADDLSDYFGVDEFAQPAIVEDALHRYLYSRYEKQRHHMSALRFRMGRSRVAALSRDHMGRKACDVSGNCLWGCHKKALYSSRDDLSLLRTFDNFFYEGGIIVDSVERKDEYWSINVREQVGRGARTYSAGKLMMAAGTLATTRLVLSALRMSEPVNLLSCPTAAFLLWMPRRVATPRESAFGLGQLSFVSTVESDVTIFGSTFSPTGIPISEFVRHVPLHRPAGITVLRELLRSCVVGNLFLPGRLSAAQVIVTSDRELRITGGYKPEVKRLMTNARKVVRKAYARLGAVMLPGSFTMAVQGGDIHYAGTLPMRESPVYGETSSSGEVFGLENLHVVDGACLSTLGEKSHTLTIMANADRIARDVARKWQSR